MHYSFRLLAMLIAFLFCASSISFGQLPSKKEVRKAEMESFKEKYDNKIKIRWDENTGTPKSIRRHKITGYSGTPIEIATQFLKDEKGMLGIDSVSQDLELKESRTILGGATRVHFIQKHKDIKVLNTGYLVIMDTEGDIFKVSGDYYPDINLASTLPSQTAEAVKATIRSDVKEGTIESVSEPELSILPEVNEKGESYTLVYRTTVLADNPRGHWDYTIDASSGKILDKNSLSCSVTGSGRVYKTDPDDCSYSTESLYRLNYSIPLCLDGTNVEVYNYDTSEAWSMTGSFIYSPGDTHFDEVMAYYHVDMFDVYQQGLGGNNLGKIEVDTHNPNYYASSFYTIDEIKFNDGNTNPDLLNPTKDAGVIAHEVTHILIYDYCDMDDEDEEDAMFEATADYFGVIYYNHMSANSTSWIGEYVDDDDYYEVRRNLDNSYHYDDFDDIEWDNFEGQSPHDNGMIYSGALWDLRTHNDVDEEDIDDIVMSSLSILDDVVDYEEGREAIEDAIDYGAYDEDYLVATAEAFYAHGIGDPPPPTVIITGPSHLEFKEIGTWTANVSDGQSPFTYVWSIKFDGESTWDVTGTGYQESGRMTTRGFTMKVVVTDDVSDTAEDTHHVSDEGEPKLVGHRNVIPDEFSIAQNYPNPFNPTTTIKFGLPEDSNVKLQIFNLQGQVVVTLVDGNLPAGFHNAKFDAASLSSGVYFYKIVAGNFSNIKRMLLIK